MNPTAAPASIWPSGAPTSPPTALAASWQPGESQRWQIRVWTFDGDSLAGVLTLPQAHRIYTLAFSPDGQRLAAASADNRATVWDLGSGRIEFTLDHAALVNVAQFSPDGRHLLTASADQTARLWDAGTGAVAGEAMRHDVRVTHAEYSSDGASVVTAAGPRARLWDVANGRLRAEHLAHQELVVSAHFSPDGRRVLTASFDRTALLWHAETELRLSEALAHPDRLTAAEFSPDWRQVVTAGFDGSGVRTGLASGGRRSGGRAAVDERLGDRGGSAVGSLGCSARALHGQAFRQLVGGVGPQPPHLGLKSISLPLFPHFLGRFPADSTGAWRRLTPVSRGKATG